MDDECPICLEPLSSNTCTLSCNHTFHSKCILDYVSKNIHNSQYIKCPLCRNVIINNIQYPLHISIDISSNPNQIISNINEDVDENSHHYQDFRFVKICLTVVATTLFTLYAFTLLNNAYTQN